MKIEECEKAREIQSKLIRCRLSKKLNDKRYYTIDMFDDINEPDIEITHGPIVGKLKDILVWLPSFLFSASYELNRSKNSANYGRSSLGGFEQNLVNFCEEWMGSARCDTPGSPSYISCLDLANEYGIDEFFCSLHNLDNVIKVIKPSECIGFRTVIQTYVDKRCGTNVNMQQMEIFGKYRIPPNTIIVDVNNIGSWCNSSKIVENNLKRIDFSNVSYNTIESVQQKISLFSRKTQYMDRCSGRFHMPFVHVSDLGLPPLGDIEFIAFNLHTEDAQSKNKNISNSQLKEIFDRQNGLPLDMGIVPQQCHVLVLNCLYKQYPFLVDATAKQIISDQANVVSFDQKLHHKFKNFTLNIEHFYPRTMLKSAGFDTNIPEVCYIMTEYGHVEIMHRQKASTPYEKAICLINAKIWDKHTAIAELTRMRDSMKIREQDENKKPIVSSHFNKAITKIEQKY